MVRVRVRCVLLTFLLAFAIVLDTVAVVYGLSEDNDRKQRPPLIGFRTEMRVQGSFLNNTSTYRWLHFNSWQCNGPPSLIYLFSQPLVSYYSGNSCGERILVLAGFTSKTIRTWSYRFETNSWGVVETNEESLPPPLSNETGSAFVTVCQSNVLYIVGHREFNSFVWLFDGHSEIWSRRPVVGDTPIIDRDGSLLYFTLLDKTARLSTTCKCCHSVVGFSLNMSVVWKLSCSDINTQRHFVWKKMKAGSNRSRSHLSEAEGLYPSGVAYLTAKAAMEEAIILVMADGGLWKYDLYSNTWSLEGTGFDPRYGFDYSRAFFDSKERMYILLSVIDWGVMLYSLTKRSWKSIEVFSKLTPQIGPFVLSYSYTVTTKNSRRLLYTDFSNKCSPSLWELHGRLGSTWNWTEIDRSTISPLSSTDGEIALAATETCSDNILYVLVRRSIGRSIFSYLELWALQLNTMAWVLLKAFRKDFTLQGVGSMHPVTAVFYGSVVLTFSVFSGTGLDAKAYNPKNISWDLADYDEMEFTQHPLARFNFCVAPLNSSALLIYGGNSFRFNGHNFYDLWVVILQSPSSSHLQWFQLQQDCEDNSSCHSRPTEEEQIKCVLVNKTLVVFGGVTRRHQTITKGLSCFRNVWHFSLIDSSWEHAFDDHDFNYYRRHMCILSALSIGPQVVVAFAGLDPGSTMIRYELWFYVVKTRTWIFHSDMISLDKFFPFIWNKQVIFFSKDFDGLSYKRLACPRGYSSRNISQESCEPCLKGFFAKGEGETTCLPCPAGLVTASIASWSSSNCSFCKENFCFYGVCLVLHGNGGPRPFCQCRLGFSGIRCNDPKNLLITLGITVAALVIVCGLVYIVCLRKKKKLREQRLLHHVDELTTVWQIGNEEITQLERIGAGGYGEVFRARYRDLSVAMKVLRMPTNDSMMWEFEREIKFMQTVRHPNIVLFLGAGRTEDGSPFIISEFVSRGSLRDLLDDNSQGLSISKKIKFCLDIARGMNFLHSLTPPRVHRDLKSDNLLISETDVVKITDFGLGRQVPVSNDCSSQRDRGRRHSFNQVSDARLPLLGLPDRDSPHALGASRWRAPELSGSRSQIRYTTADVYRYVY